ncbi:MAG: response regulator [Sandaracinaceae bacterium]|nr:response regulator [Sandaracinaceae bacterium]
MANILIVEDDPDTAALCISLFQSAGLSTMTAVDGADGLRQLRALPHPQCVVLDVDMPVLSGPEMAEQMLRHDAGEEYIPIVPVSSRENVGELAVRVGTPYFLQKAMPGYAKDLLALVTRALKERRAPGSE